VDIIRRVAVVPILPVVVVVVVPVLPAAAVDRTQVVAAGEGDRQGLFY
jgi:hypothetical protein